MTERVPSEAEIRVFLERQITHYRRTGETARMNDLLNKLANISEEREFVKLALAADTPDSTPKDHP